MKIFYFKCVELDCIPTYLALSQLILAMTIIIIDYQYQPCLSLCAGIVNLARKEEISSVLQHFIVLAERQNMALFGDVADDQKGLGSILSISCEHCSQRTRSHRPPPCTWSSLFPL
jgi:hypothetical protein